MSDENFMWISIDLSRITDWHLTLWTALFVTARFFLITYLLWENPEFNFSLVELLQLVQVRKKHQQKPKQNLKKNLTKPRCAVIRCIALRNQSLEKGNYQVTRTNWPKMITSKHPLFWDKRGVLIRKNLKRNSLVKVDSCWKKRYVRCHTRHLAL